MAGTIGIYIQSQRERVGGSIKGCRQITGQLEKAFVGVTPEEGLLVVEERREELGGRLAASVLARQVENGIDIEEQMDDYYRDRYPDIELYLAEALEGNVSEDIGSRLYAVQEWQRRLEYQAGYEEKIRIVMEQADRIQNV